jgi:hypothetical protein
VVHARLQLVIKCEHDSVSFRVGFVRGYYCDMVPDELPVIIEVSKFKLAGGDG